MPTTQHKKTRADARGQSTIEFALALPLLILLLAGIIDLGGAIQGNIVLTNATREGAQYAAAHPSDLDGINARVRGTAAGANLTICSTCISVTFPSGNTPGNPVRIAVQATYPVILTAIIRGTEVSIEKQMDIIIL